MTGLVVWAATTPARWAALPATAMKISVPAASEDLTRRSVRSGERWAEVTSMPKGTPKSLRTPRASSTVPKSDSLPRKIMTFITAPP
jgi:hypothetical protein